MRKCERIGPIFIPRIPRGGMRERSKGRAKGLSSISEISREGGRREARTWSIFLNVFFMRPILGASPPPLVEICNSFEPVLAGNRRRKEQTGEHYHLYEILCASLCIVIIQPLFPGCWRRRRRRRKVTRPIQYKLPCGRR